MVDHNRAAASDETPPASTRQGEPQLVPDRSDSFLAALSHRVFGALGRLLGHVPAASQPRRLGAGRTGGTDLPAQRVRAPSGEWQQPANMEPGSPVRSASPLVDLPLDQWVQGIGPPTEGHE